MGDPAHSLRARKKLASMSRGEAPSPQEPKQDGSLIAGSPPPEQGTTSCPPVRATEVTDTATTLPVAGRPPRDRPLWGLTH